MTALHTAVIILSVLIIPAYALIFTQIREIATLKRQLKALQDSTLTFSNNMNEYMKNQNDISQMLTDRIKKGY